MLSFLLRHSGIYSGGGHWTLAHRRWLAAQKFDHAAQQIVFQEGVDGIEDCLQRLRRLEKQQLALIVPEWSMAPVVEAYQAMRVSMIAETGPQIFTEKGPRSETRTDGSARPGGAGRGCAAGASAGR